MNPIVDLVYFNAGGGHRASALALQEAIRLQGRPWTVRLVNLAEVLDRPGSALRRLGLDPESLYNKRLARGWTLGLAQELKLLQGLIRLAHEPLCRTLQRHWQASAPDLVVSLVPNFNRLLAQSTARARPGVPFVTVMTDLADHPPHFWIEPEERQHLICGTPRAAEQALAAGVPPARVTLTSGMMLHPAFYAPLQADRDGALRALGLDPARPTGLVMFGGQGSTDMVTIARELSGVQLILLTGHNGTLAQRLRALQPTAVHLVQGFTDQVPRFMQLADFFIGKPGPGCLSEAVQMGLPVLTFDNAWTMPQERYNPRWVRETGIGLVVASPRGIGAAVTELLDRLPRLRARVGAVNNRAVFEVPATLERLLRAAPRPWEAVPQLAVAA